MNKTQKLLLVGCSVFLLTGMHLFGFHTNTVANDDFTTEHKSEFTKLTPAEIENKRQEILSMAEETLARLYKEHPEAKDEIKNAIYMNAFRIGTGPGIGYKSLHFVLIFKNELVFKQFTTIGLQVSASGDASLKIAGKGAGTSAAISLVPGVSAYQLIDTGLVAQANWGATEFLKNPDLNRKQTSEKTGEKTN